MAAPQLTNILLILKPGLPLTRNLHVCMSLPLAQNSPRSLIRTGCPLPLPLPLFWSQKMSRLPTECLLVEALRAGLSLPLPLSFPSSRKLEIASACNLPALAHLSPFSTGCSQPLCIPLPLPLPLPLNTPVTSRLSSQPVGPAGALSGGDIDR